MRVETAVELAIGCAALLLIFALVLAQAGQRYLPIDGWPWTGELARFSLVWLTFCVAGVLVTTDNHLSIEMIDMVGNEMVRRVARVLSCLIVAAVGVALCTEALELMETQSRLLSPAMQMPMSWLYGISLIGFVSVAVRGLVAAVRYAVLGVPETTLEDVLEVSTS
ncbi:MAG: TRAP transporter small permease subunit [Marmoricola sp.]